MTIIFQHISAGKIGEVQAIFTEYKKTYFRSDFVNSIRDNKGLPLLAYVKDVEMAKYLIEKGCDVNMDFAPLDKDHKVENKRTILYHLIDTLEKNEKKDQLIKYLVEECKANLNCCGWYDDQIEELLSEEYGYKISDLNNNEDKDWDGAVDFALNLAFRKKESNIVLILLENGANPNFKSTDYGRGSMICSILEELVWSKTLEIDQHHERILQLSRFGADYSVLLDEELWNHGTEQNLDNLELFKRLIQSEEIKKAFYKNFEIDEKSEIDFDDEEFDYHVLEDYIVFVVKHYLTSLHGEISNKIEKLSILDESQTKAQKIKNERKITSQQNITF